MSKSKFLSPKEIEDRLSVNAQKKRHEERRRKFKGVDHIIDVVGLHRPIDKRQLRNGIDRAIRFHHTKKDLDDTVLWKKRNRQKGKLLKVALELTKLLEDPWIADRLRMEFDIEQSFSAFKEGLVVLCQAVDRLSAGPGAPLRLKHSLNDTTVGHLAKVFEGAFKANADRRTRKEINPDMTDWLPVKNKKKKKQPSAWQTDGPFVRFVEAVYKENGLPPMGRGSIAQALTNSRRPGRRRAKSKSLPPI